MIFFHSLLREAAPLVKGPYKLPLERLSWPVQCYASISRDPYLNLAIEHYLLQKSHPDSAILFTYTNRPSIVIGRNQNPWLEVNLALLGDRRPPPKVKPGPKPKPKGLGAVDLVRRRSGGGTVFHDEGNMNWTVITPSATFTRDKSAEMVVRALRLCKIDRARVNARHDIVLDQGERGADTDPADTHSTPYEAKDFDTPRPLKVSGSAYKLTKGRALHHGTCLLSSPNLDVIPDYLHSPAKPFMTARGVESVSSPVGNIKLKAWRFGAAMMQHFAEQYNDNKTVPAITVSSRWLENEDVRKGYEELKSLEWTYLQTPQFTISTESVKDLNANLELSVRNGVVNGVSLSYKASGTSSTSQDDLDGLIGCKIHEIEHWGAVMDRALSGMDSAEKSSVVAWLNKMLPKVQK
ncbi:unnamed protein product [Zymoseptoria tritici ST99CH_3D1]|uniref:Putative lipoate-protein ligase A n=2 Tax=Zymoseptoria tritici TaxID=1047171 RepID=F9XNW1_ZYMTI|nr:uncharacterized protein MYCGRDRAFT_50623 [Zymoseptoria tritici IPO323]EGP83098.1 hypothetical protein MYCGRDRAFT_50623 [Zymoseptoria tritici IPO323]SMQ55797.1 unnamed protein product [Zymoseptoria tritici ST99CH_3D7]SMR64132.1 unnamed protein product [Zymoseptoria tritici ST99CH_3D1]